MNNNYLLKTIVWAITMTFFLSACDDETGNIGGNVMPDIDDIEVTQNIFSVISSSVKADSVLGTTSTSYLGKITDPETNATTYCDFLAQFHILDNTSFPELSSLVMDNGEIEADSIDIRLYVESYYGDSLNSMKMGIYELDTANAMKENMIYYSNIDPWKYVNNNESSVKKQVVFAVKDLTLNDSLQSVSSSVKNIRITLPKEYGSFIMRKYYSNPDYFKNSYNFIHHVCPGFYYRLLSGNGTMLAIDVSTLSVYFRYTSGDSVINGVQRMSATEEVLQNTRIENKNIDKLIECEDYTYLKTPVGIYTEVTLPIDSIYDSEHLNDTLNSAKISFARINDSVQTTYNLPIPSTLLMVKKDSLYKFFEESKVADGQTSFTASFTEKDNAYTFTNIATLISDIYYRRKTDAQIKATDSESTIKAKYAAWEETHPNWNKVLLVPVVATYSQQNVNGVTRNVLTRVRNDLSLASTRLVGGNTKDIKISVIYSQFKQ